MEVAQQPVLQFVTEIRDSTHAGEARRAAVRCAEMIGMKESDSGAVAIAVTEMATNVVKHASAGTVICAPVGENGSRGLRVLSIDKGPGIRDIASALQDGYSTSGTSGNGLGAVRRLSTHFDIYSIPGQGTCVLAEFWPHRKAPSVAPPLQFGVVSVPVRGEDVCGDGWAVRVTADNVFVMVVDGLGHGIHAAEAAREAERVLLQTDSTAPATILEACHDALRKTRGAAAAVASINKGKGTLSFAGLGNISGILMNGQNRRGLTSHNGTVGHQLHRLQEFNLPWNGDSVLIMHSDGLSTKWDLDHYPGLGSKGPSIIAAVLYRDYARGRDDATVMVVKNVA
jgi:anti-sigma regulatory factor (Ser/Thr protein kinase)